MGFFRSLCWQKLVIPLWLLLSFLYFPYSNYFLNYSMGTLRQDKEAYGKIERQLFLDRSRTALYKSLPPMVYYSVFA